MGKRRQHFKTITPSVLAPNTLVLSTRSSYRSTPPNSGLTFLTMPYAKSLIGLILHFGRAVLCTKCGFSDARRLSMHLQVSLLEPTAAIGFG